MGLITRIFINYIYDINVFVEYNNIISYIYYTIMAFFTVIVHEIVSYFDFVIIPSFNSLIAIFSLCRSYIVKYITYVFSLINKPILLPQNARAIRVFKISFVKYVVKKAVFISY